MPLGVSSSFVRSFSAGIDTRKTTQEICDAVVKPATAAARCSLVDTLVGQVDERGTPLAADATVFVSHAWAYDIRVPFEAMLEHAGECSSETYFWFDLFCGNQHGTESRDHDWWSTSFKQSIRSINSVLLVLSPWNNPIPLTRAWCLWEIFCTIDQGVELKARIPASQVADFIKALAGDFSVIMDTMVKVQAEKAEAKNPLDRHLIFQAIRASEGGFVGVNQVVKDQLRLWLLDTADAAAQRMGGSTSNTKDFASFCFNVGTALRQQGAFDRAIAYFERSVAIRTALFGPAHSSLASPLMGLGSAFRSKGEFDKSIAFHEQSLSIKLATLGESHASTALGYGNKADAHSSKGEHAEALACYEKSLTIRLRTFGRKNALTAGSYGGIGLAYKNLGDFPKAISFFEESLAIKLETIGESHPDTAKSFFNLGNLYMEADAGGQGEGRRVRDTPTGEARAVTYHERALDIRRATFGESHADTGRSYLQLGRARLLDAQASGAQASTAVTQQRLDKARDALEKSLAILVAAVGSEHPDVGACHAALGIYMGEIGGDHVRAAGHLRSGWRTQRRALGALHADTLGTQARLAHCLAHCGLWEEVREVLSEHPRLEETPDLCTLLSQATARASDMTAVDAVSCNGLSTAVEVPLSTEPVSGGGQAVVPKSETPTSAAAIPEIPELPSPREGGCGAPRTESGPLG